MRVNLELLKDRVNCCGCEACVNICPKDALYMDVDEYGYLYPYKDTDSCINCNLCFNVCNFKKNVNYNLGEKKAYAAVNKEKKQRIMSSSGGIFVKLAEYIIKQGGYVVGAAMTCGNDVETRHIIVNTLEDLKRLQGSKYVQSRIGKVYTDVLNLLKEGKLVLFSGTPCQVDGLRGFLRSDYSNLITVDIICHGVPNNKIFSDYLKYKYHNSKIRSFSFRDRKMGWGMTGSVELENGRGIKKIFFSPKNSSYFSFFLKGELYRENCYACPYASANRPGDITIGDYWGIDEEHPDFKNMINDAVSAVIANTAKGQEYIGLIIDMLDYTESSFERIAKHNSQLRQPTNYPSSRNRLLNIYRDNGYVFIEKEYIKERGTVNIYKENVKLMLKSLKNKIRNYYKGF